MIILYLVSVCVLDFKKSPPKRWGFQTNNKPQKNNTNSRILDYFVLIIY